MPQYSECDVCGNERWVSVFIYENGCGELVCDECRGNLDNEIEEGDMAAWPASPINWQERLDRVYATEDSDA